MILDNDTTLQWPENIQIIIPANRNNLDKDIVINIDKKNVKPFTIIGFAFQFMLPKNIKEIQN